MENYSLERNVITASFLDACANNPCTNGGICVDINGIPKCSCPTGFNGKHCETSGLFNIDIYYNTDTLKRILIESHSNH